MPLQLTGLIAAPFTPFNSDGSLNLDLVEPYARHLHRTGVQGAFVAGTTGESATLDHEEHVGHAALLDQPIAWEILERPETRWWNAYWQMYAVLKSLDLRGKSVLVVGCGFLLVAAIARHLLRTGYKLRT